MKPPRVTGMVLARRFSFDPVTQELGLLGLFYYLRLQGRPSAPQEFGAFVTLTGGEGEGIIELMVMHMETERHVSRVQKWIGFPPGRAAHYAYLPLKRCVFPESGRYNALVRFEGTELAQHPFDIVLEEVRRG